ncbi:MAG TPA: hypothetical protein ENK93_05100, partial [Campylobacteraceae bacterium]|nr:hypothetical protein [Campylobacteraceae bacterium]
MLVKIASLFLVLFSTLYSAPALKMFERFPKSDGGPDTRGAIWYDDKHNTVFVADHGKGLWKIDECSNTHGDTSDGDSGLWDISHEGHYIYAVGNKGLMIYDESGNLINTFSGIDGEGIYVKKGYAYIVNAGTAPADASDPESQHVKKANAKGGIIVVNVQDVANPYVETTVMTGEQFSQIRGGKVKIGNGISAVEKALLYVTSLDGKLYLFEIKGKKVTYKDDIPLFLTSEARKIFAGPKERVYINSNFGELAVVKVDKNGLKLKQEGSWHSSDDHGKGQQAPAAGGVFVKEIKDGDTKKTYALITAADGNSDGYLYWLDVTDPSNIKQVDALHDTEENYGFNDIWVNDTRIYLAAHNGFTYMGMEGARNVPVLSIKESDGTFREDANVTKHADKTGDTQTFSVRISNQDDTRTLTARLKAPASATGWEYHYFDGEKEITDKITDRGYDLRDLAPSGHRDIIVKITPRADNATDAVITITAANKEAKEICGRAVQSDAVTMKVTFKGATESFTCDGNAYI